MGAEKEMQDELMAKIISKTNSLGLKLRISGYWKAIKSLSDNFCFDSKTQDQIYDYWISKDFSVLSNKTKEMLLDCQSTFCSYAERVMEENEDGGKTE